MSLIRGIAAAMALAGARVVAATDLTVPAWSVDAAKGYWGLILFGWGVALFAGTFDR